MYRQAVNVLQLSCWLQHLKNWAPTKQNQLRTGFQILDAFSNDPQKRQENFLSTNKELN